MKAIALGRVGIWFKHDEVTMALMYCEGDDGNPKAYGLLPLTTAFGGFVGLCEAFPGCHFVIEFQDTFCFCQHLDLR